jgi:hypothetical protein
MPHQTGGANFSAGERFSKKNWRWFSAIAMELQDNPGG